VSAPALKWGVAVVGGGVAGAAACISLSRAGHRPLWIAPQGKRPAEPFGETLSPSAGPILEQLGLRALLDAGGHRRANAVFSAWGGALVERAAMLDPAGPGWVLDRRGFEDGLQHAAREVSAYRDAVLISAEASGAAWHLQLADGGNVSAAFVIDATGRAALIGRRLTGFRRIDRLLAATTILRQDGSPVDPTPATLIEAVADGWWYASLLRDGRLSLAYFSDPDLLPNGLSSDLPAWRALAGETHYVSRWLSDAGFPIVAPPRLVSAGTACLDRAAGTSPSGAGWAAAGDAAAAFDPLSSHGITTALWSGMKAGRTAADWLAGRPRVLEDYGAAVRSSFTSFLEQRRTYYGAERRFQECHFWTRRREPAAIAVPA